MLKGIVISAGYGDIPFEIKCRESETVSAGDETCTWIVSGVDNGTIAVDADGKLTTNIIDKFGFLLPATGGLGTIMIYAVDGIMVVGASVLLLNKRRVKA